MRKLQTNDVFKALRVIKQADMTSEIKQMANIADNKDLNVLDAGVEFIIRLLEKFAGEKVEQEIYEFLAGPLELKADDIKTMDPFVLIEQLQELGEMIDKEALQNFLKCVAKLVEKFK